MEAGIISGYNDGTFRPNAPITRGEFTKLLITALGKDPGSASEGHWANNYFTMAIDKGYLKENEFDDLNKKITRGEIATMISRALDKHPENVEELKLQIKDLNQIPTELQQHVARVYAAGIVSGYDDGSFRCNKTATRAEASAMLVRFLDESESAIPELIDIAEEERDFIEPKFKVEYYTSLDAYNYFGIQIKNWEDYSEYEEYYFTTECISHTEINIVDWYRKDGNLLKSNVNMIERFSMQGNEIPGNGQIYGLWKFAVWKPAGSNENFAPAEGEEMKYKITVTNGEETKEYFVTLKFKYKEFRY